MSQDKIYSVATLGLTNNEMHFIKTMIGLTSHATTNRSEGRYVWTNNLHNAQIVVVNAEDEVAMSTWKEISCNLQPPVLLLVTATNQVPYTKFYISRPFGPAKILMRLDEIAKELMAVKVEIDVFSENQSNSYQVPKRFLPDLVPQWHRALVIDDSPTVRKKLVLELGGFNIRVDTAESGERGLELLEESRYDIIFLDVVLPGLDGYQVCKNIRRGQDTKFTPIIMMTSKSSPFDRVRGKLAGCSSYLTKPMDIEAFYQLLHGYLKLVTDITDTDKKLA